MTIEKLLRIVQALLTSPNANDPLNPTIALLYLTQREEHDRVAREWTTRYSTVVKKEQEEEEEEEVERVMIVQN